MIRNPVKSSQIAAVGYDPATEILEVEFKSFKQDKPNSVYQYSNVPQAVADGLVGAESIGTYFGHTIKARPDLYPYKKIGQEKSP